MTAFTLAHIPSDIDAALGAYPPLIRRLLAVRGIVTSDDAERFLKPDWERDTHDPFLLKDMDKAVSRIMHAMEADETIAIWSDYDMDGIPGAALLFDTFREVKYEHVLHHTPHRNRDGFGLNQTGLAELKEKGVALIITIDCGIGDVELVTYANSLGMDVIVTDHHLPHETLPPAVAIVNPKQPGDTYPERMLCGAAVAYKLAQALITHISQHPSSTLTSPAIGWDKWLLDMAGMSTVADLVPLTGENRTIAHFGLVVLRKSRRPGLHALLKKARVDQRHLTEDDIGFTIAPRVNAASRMGHAGDAFALLTTNNLEEAGILADKLDRINNERKTTVAVMKREIKRRIDKLGEPKEVIVLGNPDWKPSLLGLVAGGIAEEYNRPVFLWGREEGVTIKGSCRSDGRSNVFMLMHEAKDIFLEYGGHTHSGGFSVADEHIHILEEALIEAHKKNRQSDTPHERFIDADISLADITWETHRLISKLAPYGEGNPKPLFRINDVEVTKVRTFGKAHEHLEVTVSASDGKEMCAIAFFSNPDTFHTTPKVGERITLVAHLEASSFRGMRDLRLRLVDVLA